MMKKIILLVSIFLVSSFFALGVSAETPNLLDGVVEPIKNIKIFQ